MSQAYISELRLFSFDYAPRGWAQCNGQLLAINTNQALFSLLGTNFGGNGTTNFQLPDLRGRAPLHFGNAPSGGSFALGQKAGEEAHTLLATEIPAHIHTLSGNTTTASSANTAAPAAGNSFGATGGKTKTGTFQATIYNNTGGATGALASAVIGNQGSNQAHENRQPFLVMNWCIALQGIFPSRN
jgi:microcystin-dependent protein